MGINFWAVLVSAVVSMIIGSIWYGPLFGKKFRVAMGMDKWTLEHQAKMKKNMGFSFALQFVASLVMFTVLAFFLALTHVITDFGSLGGDPSSLMGWQVGLHAGLLLWFGFVVPVKLGDAIWGGNWTLFWLAIGNMLVTLVAAGVIIGAWR